MKKLALLLAVLLLLGLLTGCSGSDTPTERPHETGYLPERVHPMLFRVTDASGAAGWLFGTIHVGDERVDMAMEKLLPTLRSCDALAVEFDIVAYEKDLAAQTAAMSSFLLTDGSSVRDHMPEELFARASDLLGKAGLMPGLMARYDLAMWSQLVDQAALITCTDFDLEKGMDRALIQASYAAGVEVRDVESPELQFGLLASFSDELNLLLIEDTLDNLEEYGSSVRELYETWVKGDPEALTALLESEESDEEASLTEAQRALLEDYNDRMLTQRNLGMRDKALEWLQAGDEVFFAVGAAHLVGEQGLVALLREAGCTVEQVDYSDAP